MRPILIPGLPRVWRSAHTLQLGLDPARAVLLDLPDPRAARILDLLDGGRPERLVLSRAAEWGVSPDDVRALLDTLQEAGLVVAGHTLVPATLGDDVRRRLTGEAASLALARVPSPAQKLRRRAAAKVLITGQGRLGAVIGVALAEAGVGDGHPHLAGP